MHKKADRKIESILDQRLDNLLSIYFAIYFILIWIGCFAIFLDNTTPITDAISKINFCILCIPMILIGMLDGYRPNLIHSTMVDDVLAAAKAVDVRFTSKMPMFSVIKNRNNATLLQEIGVADVPKDFICPISRMPMDNPVFCNQHPKRYDESSINNLLKIRNIHPVNQRPLYREELILDLKLKKKIDQFVDKKLRNSIKLKRTSSSCHSPKQINVTMLHY